MSVKRRSGNAVATVLQGIGWRPKHVWQIGVGTNHQETDCLREVWPDIEFIGFEPNPVTYRRQKDTYPGELHNLAVSNFVGKTTLLVPEGHRDGSSIVRPSEGMDHDKYEVEVTFLDHPDWRDKLNPDTLLWMDCEGSEYRALIGASSYILSSRNNVRALNVEMTNRADEESVKIYKFLRKRGYLVQHVHTNRIHAGQYDALFVQHDLFVPKYCNCPAELTRRSLSTGEFN